MRDVEERGLSKSKSVDVQGVAAHLLLRRILYHRLLLGRAGGDRGVVDGLKMHKLMYENQSGSQYLVQHAILLPLPR